MSLVQRAAIRTRNYRPRPTAANSAENAHVLRFNFGIDQQVYIPSQSGLRLPAGSVQSKARIAIEGITPIVENAGVQSNVATIGGCTVTLADVEYDLAARFADKLANNVGTRHKRVELFALHPDKLLDEDDLIYTFIMEGYDNTKDGKRKTLHLKDVTQQLTKTIFEIKEWTLHQSVGEDDMGIYISAGEDDDFRFMRGPNDPWYPNENIGYMRFGKDGEIWSYNDRVFAAGAPNVWRYAVKDRGCFNTKRQSFQIDPDDEQENRQKVKEFIYYNEDVRDALYMCTAGKVFSSTRPPPPAHWGAQLDVALVYGESISSSRFDHRVEIEEPKPQEAKTFYEKYLLPTMNDSIMPIDREGRLTLKGVDLVTPDAHGPVVFDKTNIDLDSLSPLKIKQDGLAYPITALWDYNPVSQEFDNQIFEPNIIAEAIHGKTKSRTIELPAFHTGTHAGMQVRQKIVAANERYGSPTTTISFDAKTSMRWVSVGSIARLTIDDKIIIDDSNGIAQTLDRAFLVIGRRYNPSTRTIRYFLWGTSGKALLQEQSLLTSHIPDSEYKRGAINLADVLNVVGGVLSGIHSLAPGKYYYEGNLRLAPDFYCTFTRRGSKFQLCVLGVLLIQSINPFALKGMGIHRGGAGKKSLSGSPATGAGGYFGRSIGGGGFDVRVRFRRGPQVRENIPLWSAKELAVTSVPGIYGPPPAVQVVPVFDLALNDGQFTGIPADLSGSGGVGGQGVTKYDAGKDGKAAQSNNEQLGFANLPAVPTVEHVADGADGAYGGMGIEIWSRGGGFDGAGGLDTSGGDTSAGIDEDYANLLGPSSGRAQPGVAVWINDAPRTPMPDMSALRVKAFTGRVVHDYATSERSPISVFNWPLAGRAPLTYSYYAPPPRANLASIAARTQMSPAPARVQRAQRTSLIEQFLAAQIDRNAKLIIGDEDPSDGNVDDMLITQTLLDANEPRPDFRILTSDSGWRDFVYDVDPGEYFYGALINFNRRFGTTKWHFGPTRPTDFSDGDAWTSELTGETFILYASGDINVLDGDTHQGDERNPDVNLSKTKSKGLPFTQFYYATTDPDELPGQASNSFVSDRNLLDPPIDVRPFVYSGSSGAIQFGFPVDSSNVTRYGIFLDGEKVTTVTGGFYTYTGLSPNTAYVFGVQSENDVGGESTRVNRSVTTPAGSGSTPPPSGGGTAPTITLTSAGPTVQGQTTGIEQGRGVYLTLWGISAPVDGSGNWSYTPDDPSAWAGQSFSVNVESEAGLAAVLANQPVAYQAS